MKQLKVGLFVFLMSFCLNVMYAQDHTAFVNTKTGRTVENENVKIKFTVDQLKNDMDVEAVRKKMASQKGIINATASSLQKGNYATFEVSFPERAGLSMFQTALMAADVEYVNVNGETVKTLHLVERFRK